MRGEMHGRDDVSVELSAPSIRGEYYARHPVLLSLRHTVHLAPSSSADGLGKLVPQLVPTLLEEVYAHHF